VRKTEQILAFEAKHGRPAEQVIADAINEHGSINAAARALNESPNTIYSWTLRLGIRVRTVADLPLAVPA
jgi:hypothetical protein